jgi:peptidoglycan/LPS O-acetylase OafA/YrhL
LFQNAAWADYALKHVLSSLFYSNGFIFAAHPYPNIVLWSLEIEVQFYILAPFLAGIFMIASAWKRRAFIAILIPAGSLILLLAGSLARISDANTYRMGFSLIGN